MAEKLRSCIGTRGSCSKVRNSSEALPYETAQRGHQEKFLAVGCCGPVHYTQEPGARAAMHTAATCRGQDSPTEENFLLLQCLSSALYRPLSILPANKGKIVSRRTQQSRQCTGDLKLRGRKLITSTHWPPCGEPSRRGANKPVRRYLSSPGERRESDNNLQGAGQNTLGSPAWANRKDTK